MSISFTGIDLFPLGLGLIALRWYVRRTPLPLPPGPRGWPIIGNLLDMPSGDFGKAYTEWVGMYGAGNPSFFPRETIQTIAFRLRQH
jgi:hypothetical protein